ncbi:MAG: threonylcarbamoyl-AMP synthase [Lachnospiraceae bacterium]|nr:threonylcarbamoyl-AMP synthase [Lachnospiraceae bacterium]
MSESYKTELLKVDRGNFDPVCLLPAAKLLSEGELVAFPTETVYGLGGNAEDTTASARIYAAKGRPSDNPLIVHISEKEELLKVGRDVPEVALKFAEKFWPGPLTIIVKRAEIIPKTTTGGLDTVAVRLPSDEIARSLIRLSGVYVAAPSANKSGRPSTTRAEHCMEDLDGKIPMVIDGGPVKIGLESTIVDCTNEISEDGVKKVKPLILRPGYITLEKLREIEPATEYDPAVIARVKNENIKAKAPGMKYRHYAPKGEFVIYEGDSEQVIAKINEEVAKMRALGKKTAVLATEESKDFYDADIVVSLGRRKDEEEIATKLFDVLRGFDEMGAEAIFGECFEFRGIGQAIMNRLLKAAGYNIVSLNGGKNEV